MILYAAPGDTWGIGGADFLRVYLAVCAVVLIGTLLHRRRLFGGEAAASPDLGPQQAAYLNGGAKLAVYAALGALRSAGAIAVSAGRRLSQSGPLMAGATPLDQAVYHAAGNRLRPRDLPADGWVTGAVERLRAELERAGLVTTADQRRAARTGPLLLLVLLAVGAVRLVAGLANDKPVGYLALALVVLGVLTTNLLIRSRKRTRAGDQALRRMRHAHNYLAPAQHPAWTTYGSVGTAMGIALFGTAALWAADPALAAEAEIQRQYAAASGSGSSSYSGGGSSSCGGGGGSCGGGGCDGGGCGG